MDVDLRDVLLLRFRVALKFFTQNRANDDGDLDRARAWSSSRYECRHKCLDRHDLQQHRVGIFARRRRGLPCVESPDSIRRSHNRRWRDRRDRIALSVRAATQCRSFAFSHTLLTRRIADGTHLVWERCA